MTTVTVKLDREGCYTGFEARNHAGFDVAGKDIVCAAISAILQTAVLGITEVLKLKAGYSVEEGYMMLTLDKQLSTEDRKNAAIVLGTMVAGLESLRLSYGKYLNIQERRCR